MKKAIIKFLLPFAILFTILTIVPSANGQWYPGWRGYGNYYPGYNYPHYRYNYYYPGYGYHYYPNYYYGGQYQYYYPYYRYHGYGYTYPHVRAYYSY